DNARERISKINKQIADIRKSQEGLNVAPAFSGKLLETQKLNPGDTVYGGSIAKIVDDTVMRLTQYYSYAYEGMIKKGQTMEVSIPALMTSVTGTVSDIHYVSRITPEGSKLFAVELSVPNKGILTKGMKASASAVINGESVFPYEEGEFEYNREGTLDITIGGKVISANLYDYMDVKKGQVLVRISADDSNDQISDYNDQLKEAQENLDKAIEDLEACHCYAPIDGTIIGLVKGIGDEVGANEQILTISDRSTLIISTNVDERNIGFVKVGMPVSLDQWGKPAAGYVESVSLQSTVNNGVATYPVTIAADNMDDQLQLNSYINYTIEASRSDDCLIIPIQCVYNVMLADESEAAIVYVRNYEGENGVQLMEGSGQEVPADFTPVAITTGISDNYNVEVTSGLEEGMEVFTQLVSTEVWN
ncbi:MAG: HlyD family efflux transporter periplasmic adaptor subunit, partial [Firmicutes bacterium]|nr:HlyD family efflux transporter periplasmic adaptor subunit [Bacillota bacterium]